MERKTNNFRQFDLPGTGKKKSRFLAILFGFCPGAGQMYLGKMNRGLTLMSLFFGDIALGVIFPPMLFILPLIWFYAFFDSLNLSGLNAAQLEQIPDELGSGILDQLNFSRLKKRFQGKSGWSLAGWALIVVGAYMLYEMLAYKITSFLEALFGGRIYWLTNLVSEVPQLLISVLIIWLGIRLIRGSRKPIDEMTAYGAKPYPRANVAGGAAAAGSVPPVSEPAYQAQPSPFETPSASTAYQTQPQPFKAAPAYQPEPAPFGGDASVPFEAAPEMDMTASIMGRIYAEQSSADEPRQDEPQSPLTVDPFGYSAKASFDGMGVPKNAAEEAQAWKNL